MKIDQQQVGTVEVLTPIGALVDREAEQFCQLLLERVSRGLAGTHAPAGRVVVCLEDVPYMDSIALEGLSAVNDQLFENGVNLKLAAVPSSCREILELTGISNRFEFFADVPDAVRSYL